MKSIKTTKVSKGHKTNINHSYRKIFNLIESNWIVSKIFFILIFVIFVVNKTYKEAYNAKRRQNRS